MVKVRPAIGEPLQPVYDQVISYQQMHAKVQAWHASDDTPPEHEKDLHRLWQQWTDDRDFFVVLVYSKIRTMGETCLDILVFLFNELIVCRRR